MTRIVGFVAGVIAWSALVFGVTFYLTFPSDALVARIQEEAPRVLGRDYEVTLASAVPWWLGVSASDVAILKKPGRRDPEGESALVAFASDARVRTSLFSVLSQEPSLNGAVFLGDGRLDFDVDTKSGERQLEIASLDLEADQLPLADLVGSPLVANALGGFSMVGDGEVDLEVDLTAGEAGMANGVGRVALTGEDLMLSELSSETTGPLGIDVPIKKLALVAEVDEGKGEVKEGLIDSDLFKIEVSGDFGLRDPLTSSTINFEIELSDISKDLSIVETMLKSALGADDDGGTYKLTCRGMLSRLNGRTCRPAGGRRRTPVRTPRNRDRTTRPPRDRTDTKAKTIDREKRREEIRERLRARQGRDRDEADDEDLDEEPEDLEDLELDLDEEEDLEEDELYED